MRLYCGENAPISIVEARCKISLKIQNVASSGRRGWGVGEVEEEEWSRSQPRKHIYQGWTREHDWQGWICHQSPSNGSHCRLSSWHEARWLCLMFCRCLYVIPVRCRGRLMIWHLLTANIELWAPLILRLANTNNTTGGQGAGGTPGLQSQPPNDPCWCVDLLHSVGPNTACPIRINL